MCQESYTGPLQYQKHSIASLVWWHINYLLVITIFPQVQRLKNIYVCYLMVSVGLESGQSFAVSPAGLRSWHRLGLWSHLRLYWRRVCSPTRTIVDSTQFPASCWVEGFGVLMEAVPSPGHVASSEGQLTTQHAMEVTILYSIITHMQSHTHPHFCYILYVLKQVLDSTDTQWEASHEPMKARPWASLKSLPAPSGPQVAI